MESLKHTYSKPPIYIYIFAKDVWFVWWFIINYVCKIDQESWMDQSMQSQTEMKHLYSTRVCISYSITPYRIAKWIPPKTEIFQARCLTDFCRSLVRDRRNLFPVFFSNYASRNLLTMRKPWEIHSWKIIKSECSMRTAAYVNYPMLLCLLSRMLERKYIK